VQPVPLHQCESCSHVHNGNDLVLRPLSKLMYCLWITLYPPLSMPLNNAESTSVVTCAALEWCLRVHSVHSQFIWIFTFLLFDADYLWYSHGYQLPHLVQPTQGSMSLAQSRLNWRGPQVQFTEELSLSRYNSHPIVRGIGRTDCHLNTDSDT
jgi:hypothetical protein